jgi:amidophosphoribosyltransferase
LLGGLFGVISKNHFVRDLFFGIDYHSHLGTEMGGIAFLNDDIKIICHNISNSQFKSEFQEDYSKIEGILGIGMISDEKYRQPVKFETNIGTYALCTAGYIRNEKPLYNELIKTGATFKVSDYENEKVLINQTEIVGELISRGKNIIDGIESMLKKIEGTISLLLLSQEDRSIYISGDTFPLVIGKRETDWAITSETSAFPNLGYKVFKFLQNKEIVSISESGINSRVNTSNKRKVCPFLHIYFGFPTSDYYGVNAEITRERCGGFLAEKDDVKADLVLGIADSGFPHSIGYVKRKIELAKDGIKDALKKYQKGEIDRDNFEKKITQIIDSVPPLRRPLVKYTPGWGRSYIPHTQETRELIARYKQIPNPQIIENKTIILVDDSIRRGTQLQDLLREKIWPYKPKSVHGRIASPPQMFTCIFDLSTKSIDLATSKSATKIDKDINHYLDEKSAKYKKMVEEIRKMIGFTSLKFQTVENLVKSITEAPNNIGLTKKDLCLYCWTGKC